MAKKKSNGTIHATIEVDRLILILALVGVVLLSASIGFIFGIISAPLDYVAVSTPTVTSIISE